MRIEAIAGRLAQARAAESATYLELEHAIKDAFPTLSATELQLAAGFKSRARVYQIVGRNNDMTGVQ